MPCGEVACRLSRLVRVIFSRKLWLKRHSVMPLGSLLLHGAEAAACGSEALEQHSVYDRYLSESPQSMCGRLLSQGVKAAFTDYAVARLLWPAPA